MTLRSVPTVAGGVSDDGEQSWQREQGHRERLPGTDDGSNSVICHVDADCFYAACERLREPALRGAPVVVGMGYEHGETHGAVATASYEARAFGVESAMAITEALDLLPRKREAARDPDLDVENAGFYRPVDVDYYEKVAADVKAILHDHAAVVREVSVDEAYLDVSANLDWRASGSDQPVDSGRNPAGFARELKATISDQVGITVSVGVAPTMSAAKIASDRDKPDGLTVVAPGEVRSFLAPLDVEAIHNVGPVTAGELRDLGIETAGDLAAADPSELRERFGERGLEVRRFARGEDAREVQPVGDPKSLSRESAFTDPTAESDRLRSRIRELATDVAERARQEAALYRTIGIKVVTPPFEVNTRADSLPGPVQDRDLVVETALTLLEEFEGERVRKLGVRVSNLSVTDEKQASLDGFDLPEDAGGNETDTDPERETTDGDADGGSQHAASESDGTPGDDVGGQRSLDEFDSAIK